MVQMETWNTSVPVARVTLNFSKRLNSIKYKSIVTVWSVKNATKSTITQKTCIIIKSTHIPIKRSPFQRNTVSFVRFVARPSTQKWLYLITKDRFVAPSLYTNVNYAKSTITRGAPWSFTSKPFTWKNCKSNEFLLRSKFLILYFCRQFPCSYCEKSYRTKGQKKVHERSHTKEQPFKCSHCPKQFSHRESLITHTSIHTGFKKFVCTNCGQRFSCISNLLAHRRTHKKTCGAVELPSQKRKKAEIGES